MWRKNNKDLFFNEPTLDGLDWSPEHRDASLQKVYKFVTGHADIARKWYIKKKIPKRRWAMVLRVLVIVFTSAAGLIPLLSQMITTNGHALIAPAWATVLLVTSVTFLALDKFFGFSSSWMRFIVTEMKIRTLLQEFQLNWEIEKSAGASSSDDKSLAILLNMCKQFLADLNDIIKNEVEQWRKDFQSAIQYIDDRTSELNNNGSAR